MDPIAQDLNQVVEKGNPHLMEMLSHVGRNLYFPKGILSQSAEAKEKAHKLNATIVFDLAAWGIALIATRDLRLARDVVAQVMNRYPDRGVARFLIQKLPIRVSHEPAWFLLNEILKLCTVLIIDE